MGNSIPVYVTLEFTETPQWIQVSAEKIKQIQILVSDIKLEGETTMPRLSATIKNNSLFVVPDVDVIAILYDEFHNAVSVSRTYLNMLSPEQVKNINFTFN